MHRIILIVFISLSLLSCEEQVQAPKNLINEARMSAVIADLMLLEATYNSLLIRVDDKSERMTRYSNEIFEKHGMIEKDFNESYDYYLDNPEQLENILEASFEILNRKESEVSKKKSNDLHSDSTKVPRLIEDN